MYHGQIPAGGVAAGGGFAAMLGTGNPLIAVLAGSTILVAGVTATSLLPKIRRHKK